MKIAISGETPAKAYSFEDFLEIVQRLGISAIEIWPENLPTQDGANAYSRSYSGRNLQKTKRVLNQYGITVACASFGGAFDKTYTKNTEIYTKELIECIKAAYELNAKFVNSYLYHISMESSPDYDYLAKLYRPAIEVAEKLGVILLLENEAHDSTRDPNVFKHIIDKMDSPFFRANFDAVNYYQSSYEAFPFCFNALKHSFSYIHVKDGCIYNSDNPNHDPRCKGGEMTGYNAGASIYYPRMGQGVLNIPGLINGLEQLGYDGWCTLEPHVPAELWETYITTEVEYLKNLGLV